MCLCFENARTTVIYLKLPPVIAGKGQKVTLQKVETNPALHSLQDQKMRF